MTLDASTSLRFPTLEGLLQGPSCDEFRGRFWQREPWLAPSDAACATRLRRIEFDFRAALQQAAVSPSRVEALGPPDLAGPGSPSWPDAPGGRSARVLSVERLAPRLLEVCGSLSRELSHDVSANLYVSPPQSRGLTRHLDGHDVFVLQVDGRKQWRVWRQPSGVPLDSLALLPFERPGRARRDYRGTEVGGRSVGERELGSLDAPLELELGPGQLLYLPRGCAHEAWTEDSLSAHLTIGIHLATWVDLLQVAVAQASRRDESLREGLPWGFARALPSELQLPASVRSCLDALAGVDPIDALEEIAGRFIRSTGDPAAGGNRDECPKLSESDRVRRGQPLCFVERAAAVGLCSYQDGDRGFFLPKAFAPTLRFVALVEPSEFPLCAIPGVSARDRGRLGRHLVSLGYLDLVGREAPASQAAAR